MSRYELFEKFGIELEYMVVDKESLNVNPVVDELFKKVTGDYLNEVEHPNVSWSNELISHVLEFKHTHPVSSLDTSANHFSEEIKTANKTLSELNSCLLPSSIHPWMDPKKESVIWRHKQNEIYQTYHRLFNCHNHGWSNLQSMHINISFNSDEDFHKLHSSIRGILPLIPALSSSSPYFEGRKSPLKSARLGFYLSNQKKVRSIMGDGVPEVIESEQEYLEKVLKPMYRDIAPLDENSELQEEWLNSRGAIPKFETGCVEIRLADINENPEIDLAIAWFWIEVVKSISNNLFLEVDKLSNFQLRQILELTMRDAENAKIEDRAYLSLFGLQEPILAKDLLIHLTTQINSHQEKFLSSVKELIERGTLSTRLIRNLGENPSHEKLRREYSRLADCLAKNEIYE